MSRTGKLSAATVLLFVTAIGITTSANAFQAPKHNCDAFAWWPCSTKKVDQEAPPASRRTRVIVGTPVPVPAPLPVPVPSTHLGYVTERTPVLVPAANLDRVNVRTQVFVPATNVGRATERTPVFVPSRQLDYTDPRDNPALVNGGSGGGGGGGGGGGDGGGGGGGGR